MAGGGVVGGARRRQKSKSKKGGILVGLHGRSGMLSSGMLA